MSHSHPHRQKERQPPAEDVGEPKEVLGLLSLVVHQHKIEIHGQADCPQDGAQGEVDAKERLCYAQVLYCSAWIRYVHFIVTRRGVITDIIKSIKIHQISDQVRCTHSEVHDGQMHEDPADFAAHVLEADVGEDDEEPADHGEEAGDAHY